MGLNELFRNFYLKLGKSEKKKYEILLVTFLIGILILIVGKDLFNNSNTSANTSRTDKSFQNITSNEPLEKRISDILSNIKGAGRVEVLITYDTEGEKIYAYENRTNTSESGKEDSKESDQESKIAYEEDTNGIRKPVLVKEINATPKGAIVIAEGASDKVVMKNLCDAVEVLLKLPPHRIQVFERKK